MNPEELNQLKPGDDIFIRARYKRTLEDGDVLFTHSGTNAFGEVVKGEGWTRPENIISSISSPENVIKNTETAPKYDPCRLFKKGDKVRVVAWNGRNIKSVDMPADMEVELDERAGDINVSVFWKCANNWGKCHLPQCFLELVTAVEELDTYQVEEIGGLWCVRKQEDFGLWSTQAWFSTEYHPNAKKAAEAECARLNAEYRKEQSNGNQ